MIKYRIIKTAEAFLKHVADKDLSNAVIKGVDIGALDIDWTNVNVRNATFVGCRLKSLGEECTLREGKARIFAPFDDLPYDPFRSTLYTAHELMDGYHQNDEENNSLDRRIENHFLEHGGHDPDIVEKLAQTLHDYSVDTAIKDLLGIDVKTGMPLRKGVGIMGGHLARRDDPFYAKTARMSALLAQEGYFVISGGGPGIMEAANMGAYMAPHGFDALQDAVEILAKVPEYAFPDGRLDHGYVEQAWKVVEKYPNGAESLAIPTWFYGHEPVNLFASHIAKYFSNSLREDGLLAISIYGIVYAPGSAATAQEVFADAAQNHYSTFDYISPMCFLGTSHYLLSQIYSCLAQQAAGHAYAQMITINDEPEKLLQFMKKHPPIRARPI
jgi:hypothetical protein